MLCFTDEMVKRVKLNPACWDDKATATAKAAARKENTELRNKFIILAPDVRPPVKPITIARRQR